MKILLFLDWIGTSHGRLRYFGSELTPPPSPQDWNLSWRTLVLSLPRIAPPTPQLELLIEDLGISVLSLPRILPPHKNGTNRCIHCGYRLVRTCEVLRAIMDSLVLGSDFSDSGENCSKEKIFCHYVLIIIGIV